MNQYSKYTANVFLAKCEEKHEISTKTLGGIIMFDKEFYPTPIFRMIAIFLKKSKKE